jgi:hypothetical protein
MNRLRASHKRGVSYRRYLDLSSNPEWKQEPYSLVICEKPAAALRIAQALGTASLRKASLEDIRGDQKRRCKEGNETDGPR